MATPQAYLSHALPGRIRWRIPACKGDHAYFRELEKRLANLPGVLKVEGNPLTASLVVRHQGDANDLARRAEDEQMFIVRATEPPAQSLAEDLGQAFDKADDWLARQSGGRIDVPTTLFLLFAVLAVTQMLRGRVTVPATSLAWYAFSALILARAHASQRAWQTNLEHGSE